jgi:hypothetical protein
MPTIDDFKIKKSNRKFKKVAYRPWDDSPLVSQESEPGAIQVETKIETVAQTSDDLVSHLELSPEGFNFIKDSDIDFIYRGLVGLQKSILLFLCDRIEKEDNLFFYSSYISSSEIADGTKAPKSSIPAALGRLKAKRIIFSSDFKTGPGGFSRYKIDKRISHMVHKIQGK